MRGFAIFHHMLDFAKNFIDSYNNLQKQCLGMLPERFVKHFKQETMSHTFDNMTENGARGVVFTLESSNKEDWSQSYKVTFQFTDYGDGSCCEITRGNPEDMAYRHCKCNVPDIAKAFDEVDAAFVHNMEINGIMYDVQDICRQVLTNAVVDSNEIVFVDDTGEPCRPLAKQGFRLHHFGKRIDLYSTAWRGNQYRGVMCTIVKLNDDGTFEYPTQLTMGGVPFKNLFEDAKAKLDHARNG